MSEKKLGSRQELNPGPLACCQYSGVTSEFWQPGFESTKFHLLCCGLTHSTDHLLCAVRTPKPVWKFLLSKFSVSGL